MSNQKINLVPQPKTICCTQGSVKAANLTVSEEILALVPKAGEIFPYNGDTAVQAVLDASLDKEGYFCL